MSTWNVDPTWPFDLSPADREALDVVLRLMEGTMHTFGVSQFWWEVDQHRQITWCASYAHCCQPATVVRWTVDRAFGPTFEHQHRWTMQFMYRWCLAHNITRPDLKLDADVYRD